MKLSRVEMKNVLGGVLQDSIDCQVTNNKDCGGGYSYFSCSGTASECQAYADKSCAGNDCCDDVDCRYFTNQE